MPHSDSARKRVRQNEKRRVANKSKKSAMRTQVKRVIAAIEAADKEKAEREMAQAAKRLDKAARTNIIHKNQASRRKARLQKRINSLG